ncbi:unnamed protein product [Blepharisma stoltei]|uniref:histidine kinase n=1 Tax=Blepharisma stoltei TaxID=1481888 RepID=A0AAU9KDU9_9CILI|nr:unnamed protein product [Blepharisma stoltei]
METMSEMWWKKEISDLYKLLIFYSYTLLSIGLFSRILYFMCNWSIEMEPLQVEVVILHFVNIILVKIFKNSSFKVKILVILFFTESYNCFCFYASMIKSEDSNILAVFAIMLTTRFQLPIIKNKLYLNLLLIKNLLIWCFIRINSFQDSQFRLMEINFTLSTIITCNIWHYYKMKISFEKFNLSKELEKNHEILTFITEASRDGIIVLSESLTIEFNNKNSLKLLDCDKIDLLSSISQNEYFQEKKMSGNPTSNLVIDDIMYCFNVADFTEKTLGISLVNGRNLEWKIQKISWYDKNCLFITIRDATQIITLENSIASDNMKTVLLRSVSHELRTPLNAIIYFTNDILEKHNLQTSGEIEKFKAISVSSQLMLSLINDLLDFSKMLAGVFSIHKADCQLKDIIKNACKLIQMQCKKKKLKLIIRIDERIPNRVYTDSLRLSQILLSLLTNALKFTMKGWIEVICLLDKKNQLKITIEDTGIGISVDYLIKLSSEFSSSVSPPVSPQGCGLGLYVSNSLVKKLGNKPIEIRSQPGKGSAFIFKINIFPENTQSDEYDVFTESLVEENLIRSDMSQYSIRNKNFAPSVLIVDDNELNRLVLGSILLQYHIAFDESGGGKDAIKKIAERDKLGSGYRVVIMDCDMPEIDGFEATRKINLLFRDREINEMPNIIAYTAFTLDEDRAACFECGMVDYLIKPSTPEKIISTVKKYL